MTVDRDTTAAERLAALIDRIPDSSHVTAAKDDLREVLAEHQAMRDTLRSVAEELEELPEICRHLVGPRCGEAVDRAREARRLVGEWTEADKETT